MIKQIGVAAVILGLVSASWECLNCKLMDTNAGFLFSYSYCNDEILGEELCLQDSWNTINKDSKCASEFKPGWSLSIDDDCQSDENIGTCSNFESQEELNGFALNTTKTLKANEKCTILVDATLNVGRVIFDDSDTLGVLFPGYKMG